MTRAGREPHQTKGSRTVVVDADALIALLNKDDALAGRADALLQQLVADEAILLYPATTLVEAVTTLQRKLSQPALAAKVIDLLQADQIPVEPIDTEILTSAVLLFDPTGSKRNTLFDAVVAAVAKRQHADAIFSFDAWYEKAGFRLASNLFAELSTLKGGSRAA